MRSVAMIIVLAVVAQVQGGKLGRKIKKIQEKARRDDEYIEVDRIDDEAMAQWEAAADEVAEENAVEARKRWEAVAPPEVVASKFKEHNAREAQKNVKGRKSKKRIEHSDFAHGMNPGYLRYHFSRKRKQKTGKSNTPQTKSTKKFIHKLKRVGAKVPKGIAAAAEKFKRVGAKVPKGIAAAAE